MHDYVAAFQTWAFRTWVDDENCSPFCLKLCRDFHRGLLLSGSSESAQKDNYKGYMLACVH
jgi:hypothetical protein